MGPTKRKMVYQYDMDSSRLVFEIAKLVEKESMQRCRLRITKNVILAGISRVDGLITYVAFDNFDRFFVTATGKDTLHDAVGIIYQFRSDPNRMDSLDISDSESLGAYVHEGPTEPLARARRRRRFQKKFVLS